jgi:uncharacterized cupin superfamily protein/DNA-binding Xre family transcriptional regulator
MQPEKSIGAKIVALRESKSISRNELAERSGLTPEQVEAIEEQSIIASLSALMKIARSLGVRLGTFLDDDNTLWPVIVRNEEAKRTISFSSQVSSSHSNLNFFSLAGSKAGRHIEPFLIDIQPANNQELVLSTHEGEEFLYVLEGAIKISYGNTEEVLHAGDSIYYDSIVAHYVCSADDQPAKILAVVYTPL